MSIAQQLKELRTKRKDILDGAGAMLTKAHAEKRDLTSEEVGTFESRHAEGATFKSQIDRLQKQLEADADLSALPIDQRSAGREDTARLIPSSPEQKKIRGEMEVRSFRRWMANGVGGLTAEERSIMEGHAVSPDQMEPEARALSATTGTAGAYTIPQGFVYTLETALKMYGGIVTQADYIDTDNGNLLPYPTINDTGNTGEIIGENTAVATNQDPAFGILNYNAYMFDSAVVKIPIQLLQDSAFNPDTYMGDMLKTRMGRKLNNKCTVGSGTNEPTGIVTAATLGLTAASATAISYTEILKLYHSVDPAYRDDPSCGFMFNDSVLLAIRSLVDSNGRPLFVAGGVAEGIQNDVPDKILGKPYTINQDMAVIATTNKSMLFGALKKYKIRRVKQIQMVRFGERFMDQLQIGFLAFQRFDGNLIDAGTHPVKYLQQA